MTDENKIFLLQMDTLQKRKQLTHQFLMEGELNYLSNTELLFVCPSDRHWSTHGWQSSGGMTWTLAAVCVLSCV